MSASAGTTPLKARAQKFIKRVMHRLNQDGRTLKRIRLAYQVFFLTLFFLLLALTTQSLIGGFEVNLFLEMSPLVALGTMLSSGTLYMGLAWAGVITAITLIFGRIFCSWICPLGIMNQISALIFPKKRTEEEQIAVNRSRPLYNLKYYILIFMLVTAAFGSLQVGLMDPICVVVRSFSTSLFPAAHELWPGLYPQVNFNWGWVIGGLMIAILIANRVIPRFWCRALCPLGALLGVFSRFSLFRIHRNLDNCTNCNKCVEACDGAAEPQATTKQSECLMCMNCIAECPHDALSYAFMPPKEGSEDFVQLDRRVALGSVIAGAAWLPLNRASHLNTREEGLPKAYDPKLIRPPGSLPEDQFLASCIKCDECIKVCPTNVLQPAGFEAGLEGLWTPIAVYRLGNCLQRCNLCGDVCPTGAITKFSIKDRIGNPEAEERPIRAGTAFYDHGRCLPWSMDTHCVKCEEFCPTSPKAIWSLEVTKVDRHGNTITLQQPRVDIDKCIGCGSCEWACPISEPAVYVTNAHESRAENKRLKLIG
jgi:polyferredoxin